MAAGNTSSREIIRLLMSIQVCFRKASGEISWWMKESVNLLDLIIKDYGTATLLSSAIMYHDATERNKNTTHRISEANVILTSSIPWQTEIRDYRQR